MQPLLDAIARMDLPTEAVRLFHGRGGLHPGCEHWALDAYPPVLLLTSFRAMDEAEIDAIGDALAERWRQLDAGPLNWVLQVREGGGRADTRLMAGAAPDPHEVTEDGLRYRVHVLRGQNHGLFLDMAAGRRWVREHIAGRVAADAASRTGGGWTPRLKVLNLFAYTCAFSVAALHAGADQVLNMDMSSGALAIGQQNHRLNGLEGGASFLGHDIFKSWGRIGREGPYALAIVDPPSFQKGSFVATKDYGRIVRRLPELLAPGGHAMLCLNAPELGPEFLQALVQAEAPALRFVERLANPPAFADAAPVRALKVLIYRAD
ncbi:Ribosomal RNA large subunit methyltransferase I [Xylophilus ampelinus]|nr:class I SAM-dependent methyltransferase [Variovorax sp.]VTY35619.1 Ribosomal RNA large subunit methyltransferase I [Xylophilus ampelinus]